jgi:hypothetical protein
MVPARVPGIALPAKIVSIAAIAPKAGALAAFAGKFKCV